MNDEKIKQYIKLYVRLYNKKKLDAQTYEESRSDKAFNKKFAEKAFGKKTIDEISWSSRNFKGDWCQYMFFKYLEMTNPHKLELHNYGGIDLFYDYSNTTTKKYKAALDGAKLKEEWNSFVNVEGGVNRNVNRNIHLEGMRMKRSNISGFSFPNAHLENTVIEMSCMFEASFKNSHLNGADFWGTFMPYSVFEKTDLSGVSFNQACLYGVKFKNVIVDWECNYEDSRIDTKTLFINTDISKINDNVLHSQMCYNKRRYRWEEWYKTDPAYQIQTPRISIARFMYVLSMLVFLARPKLLTWLLSSPIRKYAPLQVLCRLFWWCSNYGYSTKRTLFSFVVLTIAFATIYWGTGKYDIANNIPYSKAGIIENLFQYQTADESYLPSPYPFARSVYFSVVTMTTLGFGDIHAKPGSILGYTLLGLQVILGYILLGILLTRFAVLFTTDGPTYIPHENHEHISEKWHFLLITIVIYLTFAILVALLLNNI